MGFTSPNHTTEIKKLESDVASLNEGGLALNEDIIKDKVSEWLEENPTASEEIIEQLRPYIDKKASPEDLSFYPNLSRNLYDVPDGIVYNYQNQMSISFSDNVFTVSKLKDPISSNMTRDISGYFTVPENGTYTLSSYCKYNNLTNGLYIYILNTETSETVGDYICVGNTRSYRIRLYELQAGVKYTYRIGINATTLNKYFPSDTSSFEFTLQIEKGASSTNWENPKRLKNPEITALLQFTETRPSLSLFEKFAVIGDSYASGELCFDGTYIDHYNISWGQILARKNGTSCINMSAGGVNTQSWLTHTKGLMLMKNSEPQDIYYLALGINDINTLGSNYLGSIADITEDYKQNPNTFYGNYAKIIENIYQKAPSAKLVIFTTSLTNTALQRAYNDAIIEIAGHYGIPCLKQYESDFFNSSFYLDSMSGGHPVAVVYSAMANEFDRMLCDLIYNNIDYFYDYKR